MDPENTGVNTIIHDRLRLRFVETVAIVVIWWLPTTTIAAVTLDMPTKACLEFY